MNTRMKELMTRRPMRLVTGASCASELPRSPVTTPPSQPRYCSATGLLSPSCSLSASYRAVLAASLPRIARAVSPGRACVATKTNTDTRNSVSIPSPIRMRISFRSGGMSGVSLLRFS